MNRPRPTVAIVATVLWLATPLPCLAEELERIRIDKSGGGFGGAESGRRFIPWGFNYDHDEKGRLIEDYWDAEWSKVEEDFGQMKWLGANVVRIHLQLGKFMHAKDRPNDKALERLGRLVQLAEEKKVYLYLTGLGCYHKRDVPGWYDELAEQERWHVQARFWEAVAQRCAKSPAIFCYDLMNEPVVPQGRRKPGEWLAPPFAGKHFVQFITLDAGDRARSDIARQWIKRLVVAIRKHDRAHLITVGLVDWSLDRPGLSSGFPPAKVAGDLDFISVHIYPVKGEVDQALDTLRQFSVGKPVVIAEMFPLRCSQAELEQFVEASEPVAAGWIGFYWGKTIEEYRESKQVADVLVLQWLEFFQRKAKQLGH